MSVPKQYVDGDTECSDCGAETASTHPEYNASVCPECGHRWSSSTPSERALVAAQYGSSLYVPALGTELEVKKVVEAEQSIHAVNDSGVRYRFIIGNSGTCVAEKFDTQTREWNPATSENVVIKSEADPWVDYGVSEDVYEKPEKSQNTVHSVF